MALTYLFWGSICAYLLFTLYFTAGLHRLRNNSTPNYLPGVSVVIAARNEADTLQELLNDLVQQDYPKEKLDITVVSDRSTDGTWNIIQDYTQLYPSVRGIKIEDTDPQMTPKKRALTCGIEKTSGEVIISTDGDCSVPTGWIRSMVETFDDDTGIVVGRSTIDTTKHSFLHFYQRIDFLGIMAANAGVIGWGLGWSGSGQNIAYRRKAFEHVNGFHPVAQKRSGDDMYLVQSISKDFGIKFNADPASFVITQPMNTVKDFISQRTRWSSNSRSLWQTKIFFLLFLITAFICNSVLLIGWFIKQTTFIMPLLFIIKMISDGLVLFTGSAKLNIPIRTKDYLIWSLLQPLYIPYIGIMGLAGQFRWKE